MYDGACVSCKAQNVFNSGNQFPRPERLGYVVVCAYFKSRHGTILIAGGSKEDDRNFIGRLDRSADCKAVAV